MQFWHQKADTKGILNLQQSKTWKKNSVYILTFQVLSSFSAKFLVLSRFSHFFDKLTIGMGSWILVQNKVTLLNTNVESNKFYPCCRILTSNTTPPTLCYKHKPLESGVYPNCSVPRAWGPRWTRNTCGCALWWRWTELSERCHSWNKNISSLVKPANAQQDCSSKRTIPHLYKCIPVSAINFFGK